MQHRTRTIVTLLVTAGVFLVGGLGWFLFTQPPTVYAQAPASMTTDRVRSTCTSLKSSLNTIHTNDILMRVNIGQTYNTISGKLMARMNARLAVNRVSGTKLAQITATFEKNRAQFGTDFNRYDSAMTTLLKIDCLTSPSEFYNQLIVARDARHRVSVKVSELNDEIREYRRELVKLEPAIEQRRTQGGNE